VPIFTNEERLGTTLAGRYRLESILGEGGMGVVFAAHDERSGGHVAIKLIRPEHMQNRQVAKRFLREARAALALDHPNVVDVYATGMEEDGTTYMILELLHGESLAARLDRKVVLELETTLRLMLPVIDALAFAHSEGIVHRDIKPDNIFLARDESGETVPKVLDFGIAKTRSLGSATTFQTQTGAVMGTPRYMAPEQARGDKRAGASIDQWAVGVILYECLSGRVPMTADQPAVMLARLLTERAPPLQSVASDVPTPIAEVVDRALKSEIAERHPSISKLADALRAAAEEVGIALGPSRHSVTGLSAPPPPPAKRDHSHFHTSGATVAKAPTLPADVAEMSETGVPHFDGERLEAEVPDPAPVATATLVPIATATPVSARASVERSRPSMPRWGIAGALLVLAAGATFIVVRQAPEDAGSVTEPPEATAPPPPVEEPESTPPSPERGPPAVVPVEAPTETTPARVASRRTGMRTRSSMSARTQSVSTRVEEAAATREAMTSTNETMSARTQRVSTIEEAGATREAMTSTDETMSATMSATDETMTATSAAAETTMTEEATSSMNPLDLRPW